MRLPKAGTIEISPSILSADFARLADEVADVSRSGIKMLHLDVMDGHFVPNMTFGAPVVAKLRKYSDLNFDAHLMIENPEKYIGDFAKAGADHITFHVEATDDSEGVINQIHDLGCTAGICIKPKTPVSAIEKYIPMCEMILVMTVEPGFGGQAFMADCASKCRQIRDIGGADIRIEVDGGIDPQTAPIVVGYGADTLVAGNAVFGKPDRLASVRAILDSCK